MPEGATVVVGVDGSAHSEHALRWGAHFAAQFGADLEALSTWEVPTSFGWVSYPPEWNPGQDAAKVLAETVQRVLGEDGAVGVHQTVVQGNPAHELIARSKQAELIVVGSRGLGGFTGLLLGSVSASVSEHASCPVLVVHGDRPPPAARSLVAALPTARGETP
jgi:nucleotide-binding universal stress UspA family protein